MDLSAVDSTIRALEASISGLESLLDWLTGALIICNVVVVIGLILEYQEDAKEFFTGRPRTRRKWKQAFLGGVLVILGIIGELSIAFIAHRVETKIRQKSHKIEELLEASAGSAAAAALSAQSSAMVANMELGIAEKREADLEEKSRLFQRGLEAQGSRSRLLWDRKVRDRLGRRLKSFAGQKIEVRLSENLLASVFGTEAWDLSMILTNILSNISNWSVNPLAASNVYGQGLMIEVNSKASDSTRKAAGELLKALKEVRLADRRAKVGVSDAPRLPQIPMYTAGGVRITFPELGTDTIVLTVFAHPL